MKHLRAAARVAAVILGVAGMPAGHGALAQGAGVATVTMDGKVQPVTRAVPSGVDISGSYQYIDEPGQALVVLRADGSGDWRGDTGEATRPITWWLGADAVGQALTDPAPNGVAHLLIVEFAPGQYSGFELAIANAPRLVVINRDRVKPY